MPEIFKLAGIVIMVLGLALRLRTTLVVATAGLVTGLLAGLPLLSGVAVLDGLPLLTSPGKEGIINILGRAFVDNRLMTLFIITLPAIGLAERYGLQEQSARLIRRISAASVGRLLISYQLLRVVMGILGIRLLGHPAFVRPLIFPMAVGAAEAEATVRSAETLHEGEIEKIKAGSAASENYGNFYGQNLSSVQAGVLLVYGTLNKLGYDVSVWSIVLYATPIAALSVAVAAAQFLFLDRVLRRRLTRAAGGRD
ncbi:MAG TPA: DUF969 family protein [Pyrinomonadaceae bacterium]|nr:DUF969 family protein [Pyrinomonadaceae bacterium]